MKKKIISILLTIVMLIGVMPLGVFTAFAGGLGPKLVPDFNRDGVIDTYDRERAAAETDAFTIWLNDDDDAKGTCDGGNAGDTNTDEHNVPSGNEKKDYDDDRVNGRCDLLDFFPVLVDVREVEDWSELTWTIKSDGKANVNVVFTELSADNAGSFYTKNVKALDGETSLYEADTTPLYTEAALPEDFLNEGTGKGILLIEGSSLGEGNIVLEGIKDGSDPVIFSLPVNVVNVEDMYRTINLRQGGISETDEPTARKDADSDGRQFVFVHGYNVTHNEARGEASDFYKKLWQTGSDSMFTAVEWDSDESGMYGNESGMYGDEDYYSFNYYANVENAFAAAEAFKNECDRLPGKKYLIGHSLGNMLICSAIQDFGLEYEKYFMLNAAIAKEAFDKNAVDDGMIDDYWENNFAVSERASHWYENFGQDSDFRSTITWKGRFEDVKKNVINLYSPSDEFLANCPDDVDREADGSEVTKTFTEKLAGSGFWAFSEKIKGMDYIDVINEFFIEDTDKTDNIRPKLWMNCEGGWGVNENYVPGDSGRANTRFTPFIDERMAYEEMPFISSSEAFTLRAQLLADAIPAESYAAGSNEVSTLANINLESYIGGNKDWPSYIESEENPADRENKWKHNDTTEIAYYHTSELFYDITVSPWDRLCAGKEFEGELEVSVSDDVKTIKLLNDITADSNDESFHLYGGGSYYRVILDLNGHTIDFSQAKGSAIVLDSDLVYDYIITDSSPSQSGKIIGGTGQTLKKDDSKLYGGGVLVLNGKLTMTGGTVTGNSADIGGGIYVADGGELTVGGTAKIYGNLSKDGTADNNLYLQNNKYITVCTGSVGLDTGAEIGISKTGNGRISANGTEADAKYFFSDAEGKYIKHETDGGDRLELADAPDIGMTVTFDMQGGSGTSETAEARYTYTMPEITIPTKTGYTFEGYYDESGKVYYNASGKSVRNCDRQEDFTLYAHWKNNTYNIIYKDKGGDDFTGEHEPGYPTTYTYGSVTTLKRAIKISYDKAGKVRREFVDWFEDPDCSGSPVTSIGADCAKDITLYAKIPNCYIERSWDEESKKVISTEKEIPEYAGKITADTTELEGGWYVVDDEVTVDGRITVLSDVHIILKDNCKLEVKGGIRLIHGNTGSNLTIYAQYDGANTGRLIADSNSGTTAGIGSDGDELIGNITVHGGNITATGSYGGAGIGGVEGAVTIYGGTVTAASDTGAGISGSSPAYIYGGTVNASSIYGAGIGGGGSENGNGDSGLAHIYGGTVNASSIYGAGIGGGGSENGNGGSGSAYIYGDTVNASSIYGAGIGGGGSENGTGGSGSADIYGGTVTASSSESVGIGGTAGCSIKITGGVVTAKSEAIQGIGVICNTINYLDIGDNMSVYDSNDNLITLPEVAWNQLKGMSYVKLVEAGPQPLATPTADDFNFIPPKDCVYNGQPKQASVTTEKEGMGVITLKYQKYNGEGWNTATTDDPATPGKYRVVISVEEGTNYAASAADITSDSWVFEIVCQHNYIDYVCEHCGDELFGDAQKDAIKAIDYTADHSDDEVINLLAETAKDAIDDSRSVAEILKIKNLTISQISAIKTIIAAAGNSTNRTVKAAVIAAKTDICSAESIEDVANIRDECLADIEKLGGTTHEHTFSADWSVSETHHWHDATCEHTELSKNLGEHTFGTDGKCTVCGYEKKASELDEAKTAAKAEIDKLIKDADDDVKEIGTTAKTEIDGLTTITAVTEKLASTIAEINNKQTEKAIATAIAELEKATENVLSTQSLIIADTAKVLIEKAQSECEVQEILAKALEQIEAEEESAEFAAEKAAAIAEIDEFVKNNVPAETKKSSTYTGTLAKVKNYINASTTKAEVDERKEIALKALDEFVPEYHDVAVTNGATITKTLDTAKSTKYEVATVKIKEDNGINENGNWFVYWTDKNGNIVSTYSTYEFYVVRDVELTPVYVSPDDYDAERAKGIITTDIIRTDDNKDGTVTLFSEHSASAKAVGTILQHGIIWTTDSLQKDNLNLDNQSVKKAAAVTSANALTGLFRTTVNAGEADKVYARTYLVDANGNKIYGEMKEINVSKNIETTSFASNTLETVLVQVEEIIPEAQEETETAPAFMTILMNIINAILSLFKSIIALF